MRRLTCLAAALLACGNGIAADAPAATARTPAGRLQPAPVFLTVGVDGKPTQLSCGPTVVESVCPVLTRAVAGWSFTPATQDGTPVAVPIILTLDIAAVPESGGFALQAVGSRMDLRAPDVDGKPALTSMSDRMPPPQYPVDALRRGRGANVELELWGDPGARTWRVGKLWLDGKPASGREPFAQAAASAAGKWPTRQLAIQQRSFCTVIRFEPGTVAPPQSQPKYCTTSYQDGFAPPVLLTDVTTAAF